MRFIRLTFVILHIIFYLMGNTGKKRKGNKAKQPVATRPARRSGPWVWERHGGKTVAALLLSLLWIFSAGVYGSVFHVSQQSSYFAWDATLMHFLLQQDFGWLYAAGRLLLTTFHYPVLGGLLLSVMLTLCAWLVQRIAGFRGWLRAIPPLLPFLFLFYFVFLDYSVNYHRETSLLMLFPLVALVVLSVLLAVKRVVFRKRKDSPESPRLLKIGFFAGVAAIAVAFSAITVFSVSQRDGVRRTCRMMRLLERSDYEGMIDVATASARPSRGVAAYYAIALAQTGQLESRMFDIPYDFPDMRVREMDGSYSAGVGVYSLDADFYAGLPNESYCNTMENLVKAGPHVFYLKRLARAAMVNGERRLCWKYLQIIDRNPFEHDFVVRFKDHLANMREMADSPEYRHVYDKMPLNDAFSQMYKKPLFLGYNVELREGRSLEALNASLMALLYSKDLDGFTMRASLLGNSVMPNYYQQAVVLKSLSNNRIMGSFPAVDRQLVLARLRGFVNVAQPYLKQNQDKGRELLKDDWLDYYPYYMYFENLTPEKPAEEAKKEKGGVN